jgi:hypothetical protein
MPSRLRSALAAVLTSAALLTVAAVIHAQRAPRLPLRAAAETITAADLLRDITYLASDELAGRGTPSPGQDLAAAYVEKALRDAGIRPFGDNGTYRQHYTVTRATLKPQETTLAIGGQTFAHGSDFVLTSFLKPAVSTGDVVYVGTGIRSPKLKWDPYAHGRRARQVAAARPAAAEGVTRQMLGAAGADHMPPAQEARAARSPADRAVERCAGVSTR